MPNKKSSPNRDIKQDVEALKEYARLNEIVTTPKVLTELRAERDSLLNQVSGAENEVILAMDVKREELTKTLERDICYLESDLDRHRKSLVSLQEHCVKAQNDLELITKTINSKHSHLQALDDEIKSHETVLEELRNSMSTERKLLSSDRKQLDIELEELGKMKVSLDKQASDLINKSGVLTDRSIGLDKMDDQIRKRLDAVDDREVKVEELTKALDIEKVDVSKKMEQWNGTLRDKESELNLRLHEVGLREDGVERAKNLLVKEAESLALVQKRHEKKVKQAKFEKRNEL